MFSTLAITWDMNPVLISIFGFDIMYYSLSWMLGFLCCIWIMNKMLIKEGIDPKLTDSMFMYIFIATVVGARLGHCLFYEGSHYLHNPLEILNLRQGGMASHGAAIGIITGIYLFSKKHNLTYIWSLDRITAVVPAGGAMIRLGNLCNSEIYGTPTDLPWGFIFVRRGETIPMHPTQIYEALLYLLILVLTTYLFFKKDMAIKHPGALFGIVLMSIFGGRFIIEMIKNVQVGFEESMALNMGQILSIPFVVIGATILYLSYKKPQLFAAKKIKK